MLKLIYPMLKPIVLDGGVKRIQDVDFARYNNKINSVLDGDFLFKRY